MPTAQMSFADTAATALREWLDGPALGLGTILHCVPSQCSINVRLSYEPSSPTAQTSLAEIAATALRIPAEFGLGEIVHNCPHVGVAVADDSGAGWASLASWDALDWLANTWAWAGDR